MQRRRTDGQGGSLRAADQRDTYEHWLKMLEWYLMLPVLPLLPVILDGA